MNKKRWLIYIVLGLFFYCIFLVAGLPASWFAWGLNRYAQGKLQLDPVAGTLWSGNGRLIVYYPQSTPHDFGKIEWRVNPVWLLSGQVNLRLRAKSSDRQVDGVLRFGGDFIQVLDAEISLPATTVSALYAPVGLISPQGQVSLRTERLRIGDDLNGTAEIQWRNASSALSSVQPLGTYRLHINGAGETAALQLDTVQGVLELTGKGMWHAKTGQLQLNGAALPRERAGELESLLKLMGNDQGGGRRMWTFNMPVTPPRKPVSTSSASPAAAASIKSN